MSIITKTNRSEGSRKCFQRSYNGTGLGGGVRGGRPGGEDEDDLLQRKSAGNRRLFTQACSSVCSRLHKRVSELAASLDLHKSVCS